MMIAGIAITSGVAGSLLDPYSHLLLLKIVATVSAGAVLLTLIGIWGIERGLTRQAEASHTPFMKGLKEVWAEDKARRFTVFVFLSMTAYFMQELILEPYAGLVFGFSPGQSTSLSGAQNGGVFVGMLCVGLACTGLKLGSLRSWVICGCLGSALSLSAIAALGIDGSAAQLTAAVIALGVFNGMFAVAAIGSMMSLAGTGRGAREGTRMGLWGAAQAIAAGFGGLFGAAAADGMRLWITSAAGAFGSVFLFEAALFVLAAAMAAKTIEHKPITQNLVPGE